MLFLLQVYYYSPSVSIYVKLQQISKCFVFLLNHVNL